MNKLLVSCVSPGRPLPGDTTCQDLENTDPIPPWASTASRICPNPRFAVAAATIAAADMYGLPVSTTHVLSSGIAGTMAANGSGLQWSTIRNIALAWVLTLPIAMILSGVLYLIFSRIF